MLHISFFKNFKSKKLFDLWRGFQKKAIKLQFTEKLRRRLHYIDESLLSGYFGIRKILNEMTGIEVFKLTFNEPIPINEFKDKHVHDLKELDKKLDHYRNFLKKEIIKACTSSYEEYKALKHITLDDNNNLDGDTNNKGNKIKIKDGESGRRKIHQSLMKDNMPYAQDASRK